MNSGEFYSCESWPMCDSRLIPRVVVESEGEPEEEDKEDSLPFPKGATKPLKWHGGKEYLSEWIISHFPEHTHYVEPFFGGGRVLFNKPASLVEGHSEVINDVDWELMNFWTVLREEAYFDKFLKLAALTPLSEPAFVDAVKFLKSGSPGTGVERALKFFIRFRQSRQGLGRDFGTLSRGRTRGGMNEQVSSWLGAVDGLPAAHERLKRVVIKSCDFGSVIESEDGGTTLFYCDPPYVHETRSSSKYYNFEMSQVDHGRLLNRLEEVAGKFILSGYDCELYEAWRKRNGYRKVERKIDNKASSAKTKEMKTECLWMNF